MQAIDQQQSGLSSTYPGERRQSPRLSGPPRIYLELARWLLAQEMTGTEGALSVPDAAEQACQKLLDRLGKLITPSGCHALLARSLHLAQADFQFLRAIQPGSTPGAYLEGLRQRAEGTDPGQVQRGLAALLGILMELVALFIGDYLTGRLLREIWPDLPVLVPTQPIRTVE
jgi:hypothetical protein